MIDMMDEDDLNNLLDTYGDKRYVDGLESIVEFASTYLSFLLSC